METKPTPETIAESLDQVHMWLTIGLLVQYKYKPHVRAIDSWDPITTAIFKMRIQNGTIHMFDFRLRPQQE